MSEKCPEKSIFFFFANSRLLGGDAFSLMIFLICDFAPMMLICEFLMHGSMVKC